MSTGPLNSAAPTTSQVVGGVYNAVVPTPASGQALALQVDNEGNLLVNVAVDASISGGLSTNWQAALSSSPATVKAAPGQFYGYSIFNPNATTVYVLWYNNASPTVGTTTPVFGIGIPAGAAANFSIPQGVPCSVGIYVLATTSLASATAPSTGMVVTTLYL
jgi:hypothetical protein